MKKLLIILLCIPVFGLRLQAQEDDPYDQRGAQFAAQGTDFWVCFPRTVDGHSANTSLLYVVSERDCDVTVTNEWLGYTHTEHIARRRMCGPDTNYINIPFAFSRICDTMEYAYPLVYDYQYTGQECDKVQPKGFHVTSTDTISLFIVVHSAGLSGGCNVLPTEMLRDEYVIQTYPISRESIPLELPSPLVYFSPYIATVDIVAVDDSTVVDIVLSDWDWMNRHPGDTITVMLPKGMLFHFAVGEVREKYYPLFEPYYRYYDTYTVSPDVGHYSFRHHYSYHIPRHAFDSSLIEVDTFYVDLSGTRIKARDCKRIAVFESGGFNHVPNSFIALADDSVPCGFADMLLEQSVPVRYTGKEFIVPNIDNSDTEYIRFTALQDSTLITIFDAAHPLTPPCSLWINAYKTDWFELHPGEGPFYITASEKILTRVHLMAGLPGHVNMIGTSMGGDPAFFAFTPVEWWHNGQVNYGTLANVDENHNVQRRWYSLYIFTRTDDVSSIYLDDYAIGADFQPIPGTPYSHAHYDFNSSFNSPGTHHIRSNRGKPFMAFMASDGGHEQMVYNLPHVQPGKTYLLVDGVPSDSLSADSIRCLYDPVTFYSWDERPADSVIWIFGDGDTVAYSHLDTGFVQPQVHTYQDTGRYLVKCIFTYDYEGCFTRKPDTLTAPLWFHNHYDSAFSVLLCEGNYIFRGHEFDHTDTFYYTTYWTESGCDTLWQIDLVTCPHCSWDSDTISTEDLPWLYNGQTFYSEVHNDLVYIDIDDECDSIIHYTLIVIPNWGDPTFDSIFISVPNVITPTLETNNRFSIFCSGQIRKAEVMLFNRFGTKVAEFDGLTGYWDGTSQGRICHQGTYVYLIRYVDNRDSGWKILKGTVTLLY